ncbi:granzyme H-like isoform 1-T1 [Macrochelys suwanniensis]
MASLEIQDGHVKKKCGGFLVKTNFVLTAAHCDGDKITVKLGAHNISEQERSQQKIPVHRRIPHPQYKRKTLNNDIMLLQLAARAKLNRWVGTIALPSASDRVKPGTVCSIAGWGGTSTETGPLPDKLQEVDVVVMPDAACPRIPNGQCSDYNATSMMCVGDPKKGKDSWKVNLLLPSGVLDTSLLLVRLLGLKPGPRAGVSDQTPLRCINEWENIRSSPRGRQRPVLGVGGGAETSWIRGELVREWVDIGGCP